MTGPDQSGMEVGERWSYFAKSRDGRLGFLIALGRLRFEQDDAQSEFALKLGAGGRNERK